MRLALPVVVVLLAALAGGAPEPASAQAGTGRYIAIYADEVRAPAAATRRRERAQGFRAEHRFASAVKGFAAPLSRGQVRELRGDPAVAAVVPDRRVRATRLVPVAAGEQVPAGVRRIGAATAGAVREASGARVAVLDTGIDLDHPDLNAVNGIDCINPGTSADDDDGHGTHIAGTIGARNNGSGVTGVAPGTPVVGVKVLDSAGGGFDSDLICGIDWVTSTRTDGDPSNDIAVANLSLGAEDDAIGACPDRQDPLHAAICRSTAAGVTFVAAAGNEQRAFDDQRRPSTPAAYPEVLTVTAMADSDGAPGGVGPLACGRDDDVAAGFSNFASTAAGAAHTVAAPGACVVSLRRGGGTVSQSGTSNSAPHVAGLAALCHDEAGVVGACAGRPAAENVRRLVGYAAAKAGEDGGFGFVGDPLRPGAGRIFGHLAWGGADMRAPAVSAPTPPARSSTPAVQQLAPASILHPAKLEVARSRVLRSERALDVLAPITKRASGKVDAEFHAAGRRTRFEAQVDEEKGRLRFREDIPRAQAAMGTGILTLRYPGNDSTRGQEVRLRAAHRHADLELDRPTLGGRLRADGTISSRARGVVRVQLSWTTGGKDRIHEAHARIRDGRWKLDHELPEDVIGALMARDGTVHSYTLFTGYLPARMRGEMQAYQVLGAP